MMKMMLDKANKDGRLIEVSFCVLQHLSLERHLLKNMALVSSGHQPSCEALPGASEAAPIGEGPCVQQGSRRRSSL